MNKTKQGFNKDGRLMIFMCMHSHILRNYQLSTFKLSSLSPKSPIEGTGAGDLLEIDPMPILGLNLIDPQSSFFFQLYVYVFMYLYKICL